jgi:outer membrane immunogenic protein
MRNIFIALATTALFTGTAHAEGARLEVHGGYDATKQGASSTSGPFAFLPFSSPKGIDYGVGIGYDYGVNDKIFIGAEVNFDDSTADACRGPSPGVVAIRSCLKVNRDLSGNLRIGLNLQKGGNTKLYALAGYTNLRLKFTSRIIGGSQGNFSRSANADGVRAGVGLERNFGSRTYGKIEYRYSNYEGGFSRNQGLVGVGIRF